MSTREVELTGGAPWGFRMHGGADINQPLRISRVNPGRKASLSGIREGDVISSINGQPTKCLTNADAHSMLRGAGPVLRLGLNEDREMSPRRRSIGKGPELKRPSQMLDEVQKAIPQAPVYATIRPSNNINFASMKPSINPLPAAGEEPKFHHTNPFYTTLPTSNASKLPVPNGKPSFSTLDRNQIHNFTESKDTKYFEENITETTSLPYQYTRSNDFNGHDKSEFQSTAKDDTTTNNKNQSLPKFNNPFQSKFKDFTIKQDQIPNGKHENETLITDNLETKEEIIERSTITEKKISEIEEIKTIKKFILNGSDSYYDDKDKLLELRSNSHEPKTNTGYSSLQRQYREFNSHSPRITEYHTKLDPPGNNCKVNDCESSKYQNSDSFYTTNSYKSDFKTFESYNKDESKMDFSRKNGERYEQEYDYRQKADTLHSGSQKEILSHDQKEQNGSNLNTFVSSKPETKMECDQRNSGLAPTSERNNSAKSPSDVPATLPAKSPSDVPATLPAPSNCNTRK